MQVMSWYENLPEEEQPPRNLWWSDKLLSEWFDKVNAERKEKYGGSKKSTYEAADDVPMMSNEDADVERFIPE